MARKPLPPWVRVAQDIWLDERILANDFEARWLFIAGLGYSARQATDGVVAASAIPLLTNGMTNGQHAVHGLIDTGLWTPRADGFGPTFEHWAKWQQTAAEVVADRAAAAERQRKAREKRAAQTNGDGHEPS